MILGLKLGNLKKKLVGTAVPSDVKSGKTFVGTTGELETGTLALSGTAAATDVRSGKTFYAADFTKKTGTVVIAVSPAIAGSNTLADGTSFSASYTGSILYGIVVVYAQFASTDYNWFKYGSITTSSGTLTKLKEMNHYEDNHRKQIIVYALQNATNPKITANTGNQYVAAYGAEIVILKTA